MVLGEFIELVDFFLDVLIFFCCLDFRILKCFLFRYKNFRFELFWNDCILSLKIILVGVFLVIFIFSSFNSYIVN